MQVALTQVLKGAVIAYKLGFTHDPPMRMQGYFKDGYQHMHLLYISVQSTICKCLEAHLIRLYRGQRGCQNQSLGGKGQTTLAGLTLSTWQSKCCRGAPAWHLYVHMVGMGIKRLCYL